MKLVLIYIAATEDLLINIHSRHVAVCNALAINYSLKHEPSEKIPSTPFVMKNHTGIGYFVTSFKILDDSILRDNLVVKLFRELEALINTDILILNWLLKLIL